MVLSSSALVCGHKWLPRIIYILDLVVFHMCLGFFPTNRKKPMLNFLPHWKIIYLSDFELDLQNAVKVVFPTIKIEGCLFHLSQACHRKICELGYKSKYSTEKQFQLKVKVFCALAFLPIEHVVPAFGLCPNWGYADPPPPLSFDHFSLDHYQIIDNRIWLTPYDQ